MLGDPHETALRFDPVKQVKQHAAAGFPSKSTIFYKENRKSLVFDANARVVWKIDQSRDAS